MTDPKSTIAPEFERQLQASSHLDLAALHLYEAGREHTPSLPTYWQDEAADMRRDARYRAMAAHRRGIASCRKIAIERGAIALAIADGEPWPDCSRAINPNLPDAQRAAIAASRRQRYLHLATVMIADVFGYYETGTDTEEQRQIGIDRLRVQREQDTEASKAWRNRPLPSTVSQLRKDTQ